MKIDLNCIDKSMLSGKVAFVSDASAGIAEEVIRLFSMAGAAVAFNAKDSKQAEKVKSTVEAQGARCKAFNFSCLDAENIKQMVLEAEKELGEIQILVNYCDFEENIPFTETDEEKWNRMIELQLTNAYRFCHAVVPGMIEAGYGKIINVSSLSAKTGGYVVGAGIHYCAAEGGLLGLSRGLAMQLAENNITVNSVCPSIVDIEAEKSRNKDELDVLKKELPFNRFADPLEIAGGVLFLASPFTSWITGYSLDINGGLFMD
ncbi:MAG: SDR family oxidoreductase [Lachnospiraceae bacterium]|nr:SDR family oxidoreductase [Lachnospiraceae bacterium]